MPVMTVKEHVDLIIRCSNLETTIASLIMARENDGKIIDSLVRKNLELENQHNFDTMMLIKNPLNQLKEYKA
jgi:hypothetical protein